MGEKVSKNVTIRLPITLVDEIDKRVDGINIRNRTHFIILAVDKLIKDKK